MERGVSMRVRDIIEKMSRSQWIQVSYNNTHNIKYKGLAKDCPEQVLSYSVFMVMPFTETLIDKEGNIKRRHLIRIIVE